MTIIAKIILPGVQYFISRPHLGQATAFSETAVLQSGQFIIAIIFTPEI